MLTLTKPNNPKHVAQHFQRQWQPCRPEVNGPLEALRPQMANLSIGFLEAGLLYPTEWGRKKTAATCTCMVLGFMDWLRWTANSVIVSFVHCIDTFSG
ncbi:hypothetical protein EMCRGX_G000807 [Ephydatia muelleri]